MPTQDEIAKLAREYAEDSVDKYLPDTPLVPNARIRIVEAAKANTERLSRFLLRTHCSVSREKVRKMHDNEWEFAQFYQRKANSCINQHCRIDYEASRDIAKSRANLLESLFGA